MRQVFATKLRMTAAALGCAGRKDLVARFRAVNPATSCDIERLHKWMQHRAMPRSAQFYEDWARVIGTQRSASWLMTCSPEDLATELGARFGIEAARLDPIPSSRKGAPTGDARAEPRGPSMGGARYLCGDYIALSYAWSPYYQGSLIRGLLRIREGRGGALIATYSEKVMGVTVRMTCNRVEVGLALNLKLEDPKGPLPITMTLHKPGPPASVLTGIISGVALVSPEPTPCSGRIILLRSGARADLEDGNRYIPAQEAELADELAACGLGSPSACAATAGVVLGFLGPPTATARVAWSEQTALAAVFDPVHLLGAAALEERSVGRG